VKWCMVAGRAQQVGSHQPAAVSCKGVGGGHSMAQGLSSKLCCATRNKHAHADSCALCGGRLPIGRTAAAVLPSKRLRCVVLVVLAPAAWLGRMVWSAAMRMRACC